MVDSAPLALLLVGLAAIVWATHIVVENAIVVARHHRVSDFFIGVVVLAVGSDLPEIVVSLDAALRQLADQETDNLIIGNAIGSCFGQLGLVIGIAGLIGQLGLPRDQLVRHGGFLLAATVGLFLVGLDGSVTRLEATLLVLSFAAYIYLVIHEEGLITGARSLEVDEEREPRSVRGNWFRLLIGMAAVVLSAELIVGSAMNLATNWGVDQSYIGIAIIGVGTSLPEVMISIAAVLRHRAGLSVGNLLGSNILDTLLPIGMAALLVPVSFPRDILTFDLPMLMGLTLLVLFFLYLRNGVRWPQAAVVLAAYCSYLITLTRNL
ncbi:MAG: sodium:calcium antiporter [Gammaproteobacteria bacterium]|nr:MAG: sodium:calcium antiporter [Gammaproteobacteria bacterium]